MASLRLRVRPLQQGEVAGPNTINPLLAAVNGMHSISEHLAVGTDEAGAIELRLDVASLLNIIQQTITGGETLGFSFKATVADDMLTIAGGSVRLPNSVISVSSLSRSATNGLCAWVQIVSTSSASIQTGSSFPAVLDTSNKYVNIPLGTWNGTLWLHRHMGDIVLPMMPYFWIPGYSASDIQSLDHDATGALVWTTYGPCEEE